MTLQVAIILAAFAFTHTINVIGLEAVGAANYVLMAIIFLPFIIVFFWAIKDVQPALWSSVPPTPDINTLISVVLYNMMGFSAPAAVAAEVIDPNKNFPRSIIISIVLIVCNYFLPLFMLMTVGGSCWALWASGYFSTAAGIVAGPFMSDWIVAAAFISQITIMYPPILLHPLPFITHPSGFQTPLPSHAQPPPCLTSA